MKGSLFLVVRAANFTIDRLNRNVRRVILGGAVAIAAALGVPDVNAQTSSPLPIPTIPASVYDALMRAEVVALTPNATAQAVQLSYDELTQLYTTWLQRRNTVKAIIDALELDLFFEMSLRDEVRNLAMLRAERDQIVARLQAIYSGQGTVADQMLIPMLQERLTVIAQIEQAILASLPPNPPSIADAERQVLEMQRRLEGYKFHLGEINQLLQRLIDDMVRLLSSNVNVGLVAPPVVPPSAPTVAALPPPGGTTTTVTVPQLPAIVAAPPSVVTTLTVPPPPAVGTLPPKV